MDNMNANSHYLYRIEGFSALLSMQMLAMPMGAILQESAPASRRPAFRKIGRLNRMFAFHAYFTAILALLAASLSKVAIHMDVAALVKRAKEGDIEAVSLLYEAYSNSIYRYVLYRINNTKDAEDLTSDVFLKMVEGLPRYQITEAPFAAWLFRIAASRVADYYRQRLRHPQDELPEVLADQEDLPEDLILNAQSSELVQKALSQLNDEQQTILILRFVERRSHEDVAAIMGKSVTAVKSAQHRALLRLSELLGTAQKARHYLRGAHE